MTKTVGSSTASAAMSIGSGAIRRVSPYLKTKAGHAGKDVDVDTGGRATAAGTTGRKMKTIIFRIYTYIDCANTPSLTFSYKEVVNLFQFTYLFFIYSVVLGACVRPGCTEKIKSFKHQTLSCLDPIVSTDTDVALQLTTVKKVNFP
jgi:hypothetical protein